ncbi:MAG: MarR family transcriptional regulator [Flavobacteriaceae bacterium]|nr:MarR family transcriptional regulator [Flavobacteriaceae bacterium]
MFVHTIYVYTTMGLDEEIKNTKKLSLHTRSVLNVLYTSNFLKDFLHATFKEHDLTPQQYNVLRILRGQGGKPINMSDIQGRMVHKMSNTTRLVDKLEDKGLLHRTPCSSNRRKMEIRISDAGLVLLAKMDPKTELDNEEVLSRLSVSELETLNRILDKIRY